jgi:hypothetical protein
MTENRGIGTFTTDRQTDRIRRSTDMDHAAVYAEKGMIMMKGGNMR